MVYMWVRRVIGLLQLVALFAIFDAVFDPAGTAGAVFGGDPSIPEMPDVTGILLMGGWVILLMGSTYKLLRRGTPSRGLSFLAFATWAVSMRMIFGHPGLPRFWQYHDWRSWLELYAFLVLPWIHLVELALPPHRWAEEELAIQGHHI